VSNNDANLFSTTDDSNNQGVSAKINTKQRLLSKKWIADAFANYQFIQKNLDLSSVSTLLNLTEIEFRNHSSWESKLTGNRLTP
jgi:hypothetical protein